MFDDAIKDEFSINYDEIPDKKSYNFPIGKYTVKVIADTTGERFEQKAIILDFEIKDGNDKGKIIEKSFALWQNDKDKSDYAGQQLKEIKNALRCSGQSGSFINKFMTVNSTEKKNKDGSISKYSDVTYSVVSE